MKIAIIEDDRSLRDSLGELFSGEGYETAAAAGLREARALEEADLWLVDVMLPDGSGIDFVREKRKTSTMPILILTALDGEDSIIAGLKAGADDYIVKPFRAGELLARVDANLRRVLPGRYEIVNGELSVTVAALTEHITDGATLFGSAAFGARLQALDGAEGQWNVFTTVFDSRSDKENTGRALAELCTRYGLDYLDSTELLKEIEEACLRAWVTYGFFSLALLILFLFMAFTVSAERDMRLKDKRELLRKLGVEERSFALEKWREAIRESLYGLAALPPALAARYYLIWKELGPVGGASCYSKLLGRNLNYGEAFFETEQTVSRELYAFINTLETRSWLWLLIPLLLAVLLTAVAYGMTGKGDLKND